MSDITTAERAPILNDGELIGTGTAFVSSDDTDVVSIANVASGTPPVSHAYAVGQAPGTATITVQVGNRTGTVVASVSEAPLVITLGTPEPK